MFPGKNKRGQAEAGGDLGEVLLHQLLQAPQVLQSLQLAPVDRIFGLVFNLEISYIFGLSLNKRAMAL